MAVEEGQGERDEEAEVPSTEAEAELPELLELIDMVESASGDELAEVISKIGRRIRATPGDRDLLSDFEGIAQICQALEACNWRGPAMLAFCRVMPDVCRTSIVNRASLRDAGFLAATMKMLEEALAAKEEMSLMACCTSIAALCTANDANKQLAAQLTDADSASKGAIFLLLEALEVAAEAPLAEAMAALRSVVVDDDHRKSETQPAALENREVLLSEELYPKVREALQRGGATAKEQKYPAKLTEQVLLLLREIARGQERIQELAKPSSKLLPLVRDGLASSEPRLARAALGVLRAFALCEDVRDELSLSCETKGYVQAVRHHIATPVVCEQGFGLLANLTLRNPAMASFLNDSEHQAMSLGQLVLDKHPERPDVAKSVIQLLWSISRQNPKALAEAREANTFQGLRKMVNQREGEARWKGAVEVARQFLREFREDEGIQKKPVYNEFY